MLQAQIDLLVVEAQSGNTKAFECLVVYFHPQLLSFGLSLNSNRTVIDDALQETWISISRKLRTLKDPRAFKSWLFRVVRWRVIDLTKSKASQYESLDEHLLQGGAEMSMELDESTLELRALKQAIDQLADSEKSVITLYYLAEFSVFEISQILEIPEGTVKSRLNRARNQLQQIIVD